MSDGELLLKAILENPDCDTARLVYATTGFRRNGKSVRRYVHRLVLEAFVGPRPESTGD